MGCLAKLKIIAMRALRTLHITTPSITTLLISIAVIGLLTVVTSCAKELSCEGCRDENRPPIADAGADQLVTLPADSLWLDGSASQDPDGAITEWRWRKVSGPSLFTIVNADSSKSIVKQFEAGIYQFELTVKDNEGLAANDTVEITVKNAAVANHPPVANAGPDRTIILPVNAVSLDGSASTDPDNNITNYLWAKILGPVSSGVIVQKDSAITQVTGLAVGVYLFELTVTDATGLSDRDTVHIEVKPQASQTGLIDVIFYWREPTGTVSFVSGLYSSQSIEWDYSGSPLNLVTVQLDTLSDFLAGVWCRTCSPVCSSPYYTGIYGDKYIVTFQVPPGIYQWKAETTIKAFPSGPDIFVSITPELYNYFNTSHKTNGTVTVNPGDQCVITQIIF